MGRKHQPSAVPNFFTRKKNKVSQADHVLPSISFMELLRLNKPDWHIVLIGVAASAVMGTIYPIFAPVFSEILRVSECMGREF